LLNTIIKLEHKIIEMKNNIKNIALENQIKIIEKNQKIPNDLRSDGCIYCGEKLTEENSSEDECITCASIPEDEKPEVKDIELQGDIDEEVEKEVDTEIEEVEKTDERTGSEKEESVKIAEKMFGKDENGMVSEKAVENDEIKPEEEKKDKSVYDRKKYEDALNKETKDLIDEFNKEYGDLEPDNVEFKDEASLKKKK
jgi:hypothetical protein